MLWKLVFGFPFEECIRWWRISLSQVAPNSWRYLMFLGECRGAGIIPTRWRYLVFLGECRGARIIPTRNLFMAWFRLCKSRGGYYLTAHVSFKVSGAPSNNKGWKARYLFVSGPNWGFRLDWLAHPIGNVLPYLSEEESILVGRLKEILSSSCAIKEMTELWLVEVGLSPASRGCRPDGSRQSAWDAKGVWRETPFGSCSSAGSGGQRPPTTKALKSSSKRPTEASTQHADDLARRHKKVKILSRRHKSRHDEGGSRSHSKGKEPTTPVEGLEMPVESAEEAALPVFHHPRSMKDLYGMKVQKDDARYYALYMSDLAHQDPNKEMQVRWEKLKNSTKIWNDPSAAEEFERGLMHPKLQEIALKSGGGPEAVAAAEERAFELEKELERTKHERDEALQWLITSAKKLNNSDPFIIRLEDDLVPMETQ
ncbi:hypothetical protein GW17_00029879 [Ensete ventricosum]|nr:hypothetical protein GW17_00029879 [Ensete ventricosum]